MIRDISEVVSPGFSAATSGTAAGTVNGAAIDLRGYDSAAAVFILGSAPASGTVVASVETSATGTSAWTALGTADFVGGQAIPTHGGTAGVGTVITRGLGPEVSERYARTTFVHTGALSAPLPVAGMILRGDPKSAPVS